MMPWFDLLFPVSMIILPALILRSVALHETANADEARVKARRVYWLTALALLIHGVAMVLFETLQEEHGYGRASWVSGYSVFAFFHLWFGFAAPALAARHPGWGNVQQDTAQRSASLVPRHADPALTLPLSAWVIGWTLYAACIAALIWSVVQGAHASLLVGLIWWPSFAWGVKAVRAEAEPRDMGGSADLAGAYGDQRRFRAWGFYWLGVLGTVGLSAGVVATALDLSSAGLFYAVGGSLLGVLGAVMGTVATFRRARVNGMLRELRRKENGAAT